MAKYVSIIMVMAGLAIFSSCADKGKSVPETTNIIIDNTTPKGKDYGAYLAGRVAHLRKDFNSAADYYMQSLKNDPNNSELLGRVYVILASQGRIDEAAQFAAASQKKGDTNNFTHIIIATADMKKGFYPQALNSLERMGGNPVYKEFITPLLSSWIYAGMGKPDKAIAALNNLNKDPAFKGLYHIQAGMIYDYFGKNAEAQKNYEVIINDETTEMSFRALQVITNFYIRTNQKDKAVALSQKYNDDKLLVDMLSNLAKQNEAENPNSTQAIIDSADIGYSDALFNIAANMRQIASGTDIAHIFACLSVYSNPNNELAKLMLADILESREMYADAIKLYDEIPQTSLTYNSVQIKKASDYVMMQDYEAAEILLQSLVEDNPNNFQINLDLGDVLRLREKYSESIPYYEKALKLMKKKDINTWVIYYALGISYEQSGNWPKAEETFKKALEISDNHYFVQNYLAYSWIRQGKNMDEAMSMIVDAYHQAPSDWHISDSLGWGLYRIGKYEDAVTYLEKASEYEPANALISDHLGDAYWQAGRKDEAVFQWKHTLKMKDDTKEVDMDKVKEKIKNGLKKPQILPHDEKQINELLQQLSSSEEETEDNSEAETK